jgi:hypothetical protein
MKKASNKNAPADDDDMRSEYDFSGGIRGKYYHAMQSGYTITVHQPDGKTLVKEVKPRDDAIILALDVREYFPDSESVNTALRSLIELIPKKRSPGTKRKKRPKRSALNSGVTDAGNSN